MAYRIRLVFDRHAYTTTAGLVGPLGQVDSATVRGASDAEAIRALRESRSASRMPRIAIGHRPFLAPGDDFPASW